MSDLELLFLVLAAIYGWESACWLRRGAVAFNTWLGRRWRILHPGTLLANSYGGFVFAAPLPPLGQFVTGTQFPLSLSPHGALAFVSFSVNPGWRPPQSGACFRFDGTHSLEARGKKVLVKAALLLKASSPTYAQYVVRHLSTLQQAPPTEREKLIDNLFREQFDVKAIEHRWRDFQKLIRPIRWLTNVLFVYLFVLVPTAIWHFGLVHSWVGLLTGLLALTASTATYFRRIHKALYPAAEDERFTHFLTILLSPATAIRAHDILSRPLLETFHPLAIAQVFCPRDQLERFAEKVLREIRFPALPLCPATQNDAASVESYSRAALQRAIETFLTQNKINSDTLLRAPAPTDETCRSYCPRCQAQFTTQGGKCDDCGGLALIAFPRDHRASNSSRAREVR